MSDAQASEATGADSGVTATDAPAPAPATSAAPAPAAQSAAQVDSLLTSEPATAPETNADGTPKEGAETSKEKAEGADKPVEYTDFELPENVTLDAPVMDEFKGLAKELSLSQEQAQKLVSLGAKMQTGNIDKLRAVVDDSAKQWADTARADAEYGGAKFDENLSVAKKALDTFGTPELKNLLKESRLGSHPEVIRLLFKAGKAISQDGFVPGRASAQTAKDTASVLYGSTTK